MRVGCKGAQRVEEPAALIGEALPDPRDVGVSRHLHEDPGEAGPMSALHRVRGQPGDLHESFTGVMGTRGRSLRFALDDDVPNDTERNSTERPGSS